MSLSEKDQAIRLANYILERPNGDPDDDLAVLSRQFLRALEHQEKRTYWSDIPDIQPDIKDGETVCEHGNRPFECKPCRTLERSLGGPACEIIEPYS